MLPNLVFIYENQYLQIATQALSNGVYCVHIDTGSVNKLYSMAGLLEQHDVLFMSLFVTMCYLSYIHRDKGKFSSLGLTSANL